MEASSKTTAEAIASLLSSGEEELLAQLAEAELGEGLGLSSEDFGRLVLAGRRWLEVNQQRLRDLLCTAPGLAAFREGVATEDGILAAAVADILLAAYQLPTAATVAVLLVRRGLSSICSS